MQTRKLEADMNVVTLKQIGKTYHLDAVDVPALIDIDLEIRPNCFTVISGPSGSGKTTLLNLIGCIDQPDSGEVIVAGEAVQLLSDDALSDFRAHHIGFIFQNFNLLPVLTVEENVEYPQLFAPHVVFHRLHAGNPARDADRFGHGGVITDQSAELDHALESFDFDLRHFQRRLVEYRRFNLGGDNRIIDVLPRALSAGVGGAAYDGDGNQQGKKRGEYAGE